MEVPKTFKPKKNSEKNLKELLKPRRKKTATDIYEELLDYKEVYEPKGIIQTFEFIYEKNLDLLPPILIDKQGLLWRPKYHTTEHKEEDARFYLELSGHGGNYMHYYCKKDMDSIIVGYDINGLPKRKNHDGTISLGIGIKNTGHQSWEVHQEKALINKLFDILDFYENDLERIKKDLEKEGYYLVI